MNTRISNSEMSHYQNVPDSPDSGATLSEVAQARKNVLDAFDRVRNLLDVSTELLTESQRGGILQRSVEYDCNRQQESDSIPASECGQS